MAPSYVSPVLPPPSNYNNNTSINNSNGLKNSYNSTYSSHTQNSISSSNTSSMQTLTVPGRLPLRRTMKHSMLPDIAEMSPISPPPERSPVRMRPVSISSILTDGTIEVDGFGFLEEDDYEFGQDSENWDTESLAPSLYEGSVYDGENDDGRVTPSTLSRRAERVLQNAKKKLDLCGQNLTIARHSLIVSPPGSALSRYSDPDSDPGAGERRIPPTSNPPSRTATPTAGMPTTKRESPVQPLSALPPHLTQARNLSHLRTVSESAVPTASNLARVNSINNGRNSAEPTVSHNPDIVRSKSAHQMRTLRDQMKDLRGKISSLQRQAQVDSLKRRSTNNLRASQAYQGPLGRSTPTWEEEEEEEDVGYRHSPANPSSLSSSRASTPKPRQVQRESRHEDREDAFSYDSLFLGNGIYAPRAILEEPIVIPTRNRAQSIDRYSDAHSDHTEVGHPQPRTSPTGSDRLRRVRSPTLKRGDSFTSLSSYATADEGGTSGFRSPSSIGSSNSSASSHAAARAVARASAKSRLSPTSSMEDKSRDDGYHSAPHTPRSMTTNSHDKTVNSASAGINSTSPPPTVITPTSSSTTVARSSSAASMHTRGGLILLENSTAQHGARIMSGIAEIEVSSGGDVLMSSSALGEEPVTLRLAEEDRVLIERLIEELGKTCCAMECAEDEVEVMVYRRKLVTALRVFEV